MGKGVTDDKQTPGWTGEESDSMPALRRVVFVVKLPPTGEHHLAQESRTFSGGAVTVLGASGSIYLIEAF